MADLTTRLTSGFTLLAPDRRVTPARWRRLMAVQAIGALAFGPPDLT